MTLEISSPKVWSNVSRDIGLDRFGQHQCDCACPISIDYDGVNFQPLTQAVSVGTVQNVKLSEDIFLDHIGGNTVALSAKGTHVVVLDEQANRLLAGLNSTPSVQSLRSVVAWPNFVFDQMIGLLLAEGILTSPEAEQPKVIQNDSTTLTAWLHLINGCNLSCHYCYLSFNGRQMEAATARDAVESIYRSAMANGYSRVKLKYAGGEPTLNFKTLLAAQRHAQELSAQTNISLDAVILTNGVRLTDAQIDALLAHNIRVMVSLDGIGNFHDGQRPLAGSNKSSYEHISRTLEHLQERGISPHISITITNKSIAGLSELVEYLLDRELRFSFNFFRELNDSPPNRELSFNAPELVAGLKAVFCIIERRLPRYSLLGNLSDLADARASHSHTCGVGRNYMVINYDGNVAKCQMEMEQPVTTIHVDDPLTFIRADTIGIQNLGVEQKELDKCVWRYRCTGGCPRLTFHRTGRYNAKSPMCEIYEAILPEIVRLEALRLVRYEKPWDFGR